MEDELHVLCLVEDCPLFDRREWIEVMVERICSLSVSAVYTDVLPGFDTWSTQALKQATYEMREVLGKTLG